MWCSCSSSLWIIVISYLSMASWLSDAPWSAVKGTALGLHSEGFYGCGELLDDAENVPPASYEYNVCTKNGYCTYLFHSPRATDTICETSLLFTPCCECRRLLSGALSCFKFAAGAALNDTPCDQTLYGCLTICLGGLNYRADIARVKFRNKGHGQGESSQWGWSPDRDVLRHDAGASRPTSSRTSAYAPTTWQHAAHSLREVLQSAGSGEDSTLGSNHARAAEKGHMDTTTWSGSTRIRAWTSFDVVEQGGRDSVQSIQSSGYM